MDDTMIFLWAWVIFAVVAAIIIWSLYGYPKWRVWASHQRGLADLMAAKNEQQIQVAQAQGRVDAAELNKKAAIIEAEAVSAQIEAIGKQLTTHDLYLRWQQTAPDRPWRGGVGEMDEILRGHFGT